MTEILCMVQGVILFVFGYLLGTLRRGPAAAPTAGKKETPPRPESLSRFFAEISSFLNYDGTEQPEYREGETE